VNLILGGSAVSRWARPAWPPRWWPVGLAWALWVLTLLGLATAAWLDQLLRKAGRPELSWLGAGTAASVVAAVTAATVGAVVASRRPRHPVGWLLLATGLALTLSGAGGGLNIVPLSCAGFVLLLTPTGTLPSARWCWWARVAAAAAVVFVLASTLTLQPVYPEYPDIRSPIGVEALAEPPLDALVPLAGLVVMVALVVGAWSLVGRFRRARGVERQQLRWLAWGATLAAVALVVAIVELALDGDTVLFQAALGACLALLPLATGAAILRYRLYDLDRIISRTLAYGLLTLLLGGGYAGVVLGQPSQASLWLRPQSGPMSAA
jgi:hypothetical protein